MVGDLSSNHKMGPPGRPPPPPSKTRLTSTRSSVSSRVRPRKAQIGGLSQVINTNLSAHPRTDPVNALNVLLKLLTSLPSRIGGCQYKLTPAEHALSLHLVGIIDPFLYHGVRALAPNPHNVPSAPAVGLIHQPTEILDAILFHVDSRKDLLNVALGCKRLHDVVCPRHFDYRVIRCKVSSISVWNHLVKNRSLARNVRKLEIIDERASGVRGSTGAGQRGMLVPRGMLQRDTDLESTDDELTMHSKQERFLAAALLRMTGLKEFKWSCVHSPISIANVWPTIMMRAASLRSMEIYDNLVFSPKVMVDDCSDESGSDSDSEGGPSNAQDLMVRAASSSLLDMTSVVFRSTSHSYGTAKQPELGHISAMLDQCANLKDLEITYITPRGAAASGSSSRARPLADEFFLYSRWVNLTTLTLANLRCATSSAPTAFLAGHPNLEVLNIDISTYSNLVHLPDGSLPRLRELRASKDIINAILECPCDTPRPLESLKGFKLSGHPTTSNNLVTSSSRSVSDTAFLANLKRAGNAIRSIELIGWHDMEDIRKLTACVSNIQHLDVGRRLGVVGARQAGASDKGANSGPVANIIEWTELLALLPELTTMHGVKFFYEVASAAVGAPILLTSSSNIANGSWLASNSYSTPAASVSVSPIPPVGGAPSTFGPAKTQPQISMVERSRMRKNDEIAGVLAWKCPKLRRVDHWEDASGKVIVLVRDHGNSSEEVGCGRDKFRWEVRRVKH